MRNLKERYRRTVERKIDEGEDIIFDEEKGLINEKTGKVVIDIKLIRGLSDDESDSDDENIIDNEINEKLKIEDEKESFDRKENRVEISDANDEVDEESDVQDEINENEINKTEKLTKVK
jgi:hypothetical protein